MPMGVFFTYKAVGDSAVFNVDAYRNFFRRITGHTVGRTLTIKEVRMTEVEKPVALDMLRTFLNNTEAMLTLVNRRQRLLRVFDSRPAELRGELNTLVDYLSNSTDIYIINLLNQYPFTPTAKRLEAIAETTRSIIRRVEPPQSFTKDI